MHSNDAQLFMGLLSTVSISIIFLQSSPQPPPTHHSVSPLVHRVDQRLLAGTSSNIKPSQRPLANNGSNINPLSLCPGKRFTSNAN